MSEDPATDEAGDDARTGPPDELAYRRAISWFVTGITVMTATDAEGRPHGMTANSVTSVSLDPLLLLVCVERSAQMAAAVDAGGVFALSVLASDQEALSARFADPSRGYGEVEFDGVAWSAGATGARLLDGAAARLECEVHEVLPGGDHLVVLGRVVRAEVGEADGTLLYTPDGYGTWHR